MKNKKLILFFSFSLLIGLLWISPILAQEDEYVDPNVPESWYEAPQSASEIGIEEFQQSPVLDEKVKIGELETVEERLPKDPPAIEPYEEIGEYGGTALIWDRSIEQWALDDFSEATALRVTVDGKKIIPSHIKEYEYTDDYKGLTFHLYEGMKWSNGDDFTSDDYLYWWKYEANNEDLTPVPPENWNPPLVDVTAEDKWTVTFHYDRAVPNAHLGFIGSMPNVSPSEYMKQFHPEFVGKDKVVEMAEEVDLNSWYEYYQRILQDSPFHPEYEHQRPVLNEFVAVKRTETSLVAERNPYFAFVDTEGNQLPYIDKLRLQVSTEEEMISTKAATGEATFESNALKTSDIPLYKKNEEKESYKTLMYNRALGAESAIRLNLTTKKEKYAPIFNDVRFRRAMSLAIDRDNINEKVYFGKAEPRQATVPPINEEFKDEYAEAYAEYDPERAEELLDEMGMVDVDDDGYRETPDGENFNPALIYCKTTPVYPTPILELANSDWNEIGLDIDVKKISRELVEVRWPANEGDISIWTLDGVAGAVFNNFSGMRFFAPVSSPAYTQWPTWVNWYESGGEEGEEPPSEIKELIDYAEQAIYSTSEEDRSQAVTELLESQAENLWIIGTVGMAPHPVIVSEDLKNVPEKGLWDAYLGYNSPFNFHQFYLEQ